VVEGEVRVINNNDEDRIIGNSEKIENEYFGLKIVYNGVKNLMEDALHEV